MMPASAPNASLPLQMLVVDDSRVIRKVAARIATSLGFLVREAENGAEALAACRIAMPDMILLDWNMPVMDGYDALLAVRRLPGGDRPKVVFCTTENEMSQIVKAMDGGADEYIMKPFDTEIMRSKIQEVGLIAA